jgi:hypothetical protein
LLADDLIGDDLSCFFQANITQRVGPLGQLAFGICIFESFTLGDLLKLFPTTLAAKYGTQNMENMMPKIWCQA